MVDLDDAWLAKEDIPFQILPFFAGASVAPAGARSFPVEASAPVRTNGSGTTGSEFEFSSAG